MIPKSYQKMCEIYKLFGSGDFSEQAMMDMYEAETFGKKTITIDGFNGIGQVNGYAVGKKYLNVQVSSWIQQVNLFNNGVETIPYLGWYNILKELYSDPIFPHWWLDKVFKNFIKEKNDFYNEVLKHSEKDWVLNTFNQMKIDCKKN